MDGNLRALKALVIGLGVMILAGVTILGYGMYQKASDPNFTFFKKSESQAPAQPAPEPPLAIAASSMDIGFGDIDLKVPEGTRIAEAHIAGRYLVLRLTGAVERVALISLETGQATGSVTLTPSTP
ncbi:MAG: hypothetical protein ACPGO3_11005 [Magnetospiraceae bacterium]